MDQADMTFGCVLFSPGSMDRPINHPRALRMGCNFTLILVIIVATLATYGIDKAGVKMQKIGKIPKGFRTFEPYSMTFSQFTDLVWLFVEIRFLGPGRVVISAMCY